MNLKHAILFACTLISFTACKKETVTLIDKQVRLELSAVFDVGTSDTTWYMPYYETYQLVKFNKHNYIYDRVKSIIFSPSMHTSDQNVSCIVDLYNVTDSVPIAGSQVVSNDISWHFYESQDIKDALPDKEITLSIRVRSQKMGTFVSTGVRNFIFINRE
ncbi:hypothetical protein A3860_14920 [Niastella vici]|uniref:Gliding motility lipoprotein GldH n=1 Tax=Niastella vici TaxID=1703345 RepID=A0A1V9G5P5_9BACT|nr:hypothetical protein [Niastella vici]OQP65882.1 hypothetical protein A3860_14920 [Niastella vici]